MYEELVGLLEKAAKHDVRPKLWLYDLPDHALDELAPMSMDKAADTGNFSLRYRETTVDGVLVTLFAERRLR
jgi:hypothetical protein